MERQRAGGQGRPRWWPLVRDLVTAFQHHQVGMLSRQAAFSLLYALPAMIALLVALAAIVDRFTDTGLSPVLRREIDSRAPAELQPLLESLVQHAITEQDGGTAALGAVIAFTIALWSGSGGASALAYACNRVFDVTDTRSWVRGQLLSLGLTLAGGAMVIAAFVLVIVGEHVDTWLVGRPGSSLLISFVSSWLLPGLLVFAAVLLLYLLAPDLPVSLRWSVPGAGLASLATLVAFAAFDRIVALIDPGSAFGATGSVLVLLWTLDLVSLFVVAGAIVTAVLREHYDTGLVTWRERHPERRLSSEV